MRFWICWSVLLAIVVVAIALQVRDAMEIARCRSNDVLVLCAGPLDAWLMPATVATGLGLLVTAAWKLLSSRSGDPVH